VNVLVTGGSGFLGSRVAARYPDCRTPSHYGLDYGLDLCDPSLTAYYFRRTRPELVIHCAGEVGGIGANRRRPGRFWYANLQMGLNVLEQCRMHDCRLVMVGTVCSYPASPPRPFQPADLWEGYPEASNAAYGLAKRALVDGAQAYRAQYGLDVVTVIPANLYGPGQDDDPHDSHVVPALIRKMSDPLAEQVRLWGDGSATRDFLHVDDAADAIVAAADRYHSPIPLNLGTGVETSIRQLANLIAELVRYPVEIVWDPGCPGGQRRRVLDVSRARDLVGWTAATPLRDGLERMLPKGNLVKHAAAKSPPA